MQDTSWYHKLNRAGIGTFQYLSGVLVQVIHLLLLQRLSSTKPEVAVMFFRSVLILSILPGFLSIIPREHSSIACVRFAADHSGEYWL